MKENYELDKDVTLSYIKSPACPGVAMSWCSECLIFANPLESKDRRVSADRMLVCKKISPNTDIKYGSAYSQVLEDDLFFFMVSQRILKN